MSGRLQVLLAVVGALTVSACTASRDASQAAATVDRFYSTYLSSYVSRRDFGGGLPSRTHMAGLQPFLSSNLKKLIANALEYQRVFIEQHPDEPSRGGGPPVIYKPPFIDGDYFTSSFEGYTSFSVPGVVAVPDGSWRVIVQFRFEKAEWQDVVFVIKEGRDYLIDDILFSGGGDFNPPGRLSRMLRWREK